MRKIPKKEARAYIKRWKMVNLVLDEELRRTSTETKFEKMDVPYRTAVELSLLTGLWRSKQETEDEVRRRWLRLQTILP